MNVEQLLDDIIVREGEYTNTLGDHGGPTKYGITARSLGLWRRLGRTATIAEIQALQVSEAKDIYRATYVTPFIQVYPDELRAQLVDFGVNSGVYKAKVTFQDVLHVQADGILGPDTFNALHSASADLINDALVAARVHFFVEIVDDDETQRQFFYGWVRRAVTFLSSSTFHGANS